MSRPRVVLIVQARMGSTRLPGKVLMDLEGAPMLERQLERLERCESVDTIVVATSSRPQDDAIADVTRSRPGVELFRGSEHDVLSRFWGAARAFTADLVVRITADCPLIDPIIVDDAVDRLLSAANGAHYASNSHVRTYPRGLDVEVFTVAALSEAQQMARSTFEREHVTPYIWKRPERFGQLHVTDDEDRSELRWTVDTPEDLELVRRIYRELYPERRDFGYHDVLRLIDRKPELLHINDHIVQKPSTP